jgi:hypothetical protein
VVDSVRAAAEGATTRTRVPQLAVVVMLIALPLAVPMSWFLGVLALVVDRPHGWRLTLAMSPGGLYVPLWLYGHGPEVGWVGCAMGAATAFGCLLATHRIMSR